MTDAALSPRNLNREELVAELRALRPAFEREGVTHMALFGSRARGDNRPDSDVDVVIEVDPGRTFSLVEVARISRAVEDRFGVSASVAMRRSMKPAMRAAVARDQIAVF